MILRKLQEFVPSLNSKTQIFYVKSSISLLLLKNSRNHVNYSNLPYMWKGVKKLHAKR